MKWSIVRGRLFGGSEKRGGPTTFLSLAEQASLFGPRPPSLFPIYIFEISLSSRTGVGFLLVWALSEGREA